MEKTLVGDRLLVNSFVFGPHAFAWERKLFPLRPIERGDVVVFRYPQEPSVPYIKRVVAKAGDVVQLLENRLYINGQPMREAYVNLPDTVKYGPASPIHVPDTSLEYPCFIHERDAFRENPDPFTAPPLHRRVAKSLPAGNCCKSDEWHLFIMGDNRNNQDAVFWRIG